MRIENVAETRAAVADILQAQNSLWTTRFDHNRENRLIHLSQAIHRYAEQQDMHALDELMYYLRIYSYYGDYKGLPEEAWQQLNMALLSVANMPGFLSQDDKAYRLQEHYAVALYRYYTDEHLKRFFKDHHKILAKQLAFLRSNPSDSDAYEYAFYETLRSFGFIPYLATLNKHKDLMQTLANKSELAEGLIELIKHGPHKRRNEQWPVESALWGLAMHYNMLNEMHKLDHNNEWSEKETNAADKMRTALLKKLDEKVLSLLEQIKQQHGEDASKRMFSTVYLVNTYRMRDHCKLDAAENKKKAEFAGLCYLPKLDDVLPINHVCSDSVYIRASSMTEQELKQSCDRMLSQTDMFHTLLKTNRKPVANDFNDALRVVIFDNYSEYNRYAALVFNINTDNGGMYLEGNPSNPDNIATFLSYESWWLGPEFGVWNLNHEYMHYVDGRFVKYGGDQHFPSNTTWWVEAIAEYTCKVNDNTEAFQLLADTEEKDWPTLRQIFDTEYKDGRDRVYRWSYQAIRFLFEEHQNDAVEMSQFLKTDYFEGHMKVLDRVAKDRQTEFKTWQKKHLNNLKAVGEQKEELPRMLFRYAYRTYLQPSYLKMDDAHRHIINNYEYRD